MGRSIDGAWEISIQENWGKISIQTKVDPLAKPGSKITNPVEITCKEMCRNISIINTTVAGERLNITKSAYPNPVSPDEILTYTIVYRNDGDTIETNVTIFDWLDSHVDLVDVTSNPLLNGSNYGTITGGAWATSIQERWAR